MPKFILGLYPQLNRLNMIIVFVAKFLILPYGKMDIWSNHLIGKAENDSFLPINDCLEIEELGPQLL